MTTSRRSGSIRFAHISDTHIMPDTIGRNQVALDHLGSIDDAGVEFVIHTGDLVAEPSEWAYRAYDSVVSRLDVPIYCVPGNHDVYNTAIDDAEAPWWAQLTIDSSRVTDFGTWVGPNWYRFHHKGTLFLGLNSQLINSGLPEEPEQWAWLEQTLEAEASNATNVVLFMHKPLFVGHPEESLDASDFAQRYCVIMPPGRDRLLDLVRGHGVNAVLTGHLHTPLDLSHRWPEGLVTRFITTGTSGSASPMAIDTFGLAGTPVGGVGYHLVHLDEYGLTAEYQRHQAEVIRGHWELADCAVSRLSIDSSPERQGELNWYDLDYVTRLPDWQETVPQKRRQFAGYPNEAYYVRQVFEAQEDQVALYLHIDTGCAFRIYLNGTLLNRTDALVVRPPTWVSANESVVINGPRLALGLDQRLVRKGGNILALRFSGFGEDVEPSTLALSRFQPEDQAWGPR